MIIGLYSELNPFIQAHYKVDKNDFDKAVEIVRRAYESYWDDCEQCYGDVIENALENNKIAFLSSYATENEDGEITDLPDIEDVMIG